MQSFWWFPINLAFGLVIMSTSIWFLLCMIIHKLTSRKDYETNPMIFITWVIASVGLGVFSIIGLYYGPIFLLLGFFGLSFSVLFIVFAKPHADGAYTPMAESFRPTEEVPTAHCPDCNTPIQLKGGVIRPDGSIICTQCFKKFVPG